MKIMLAFIFFMGSSLELFANSSHRNLEEIETSWVETLEFPVGPRRDNLFLELVTDISDVIIDFPSQAAPLIVKSAILLTIAKDATAFVALRLVKEAKVLLEKAIDINPKARAGSALVVMGVLHYKVPGWPIAFGNDGEAELYLQKGLEINPGGVSSNYFYADFLLEQGEEELALLYFQRAIDAQLDYESRSYKIKKKHKALARAAILRLS